MKKKFKVGQKLLWVVDDFDGSARIPAVVTEVHADHVLALSEDGMTLWINGFNEEQFIEL